VKYQTAVQKVFKRLQATYGFTIVNGNRSAEAVNLELRKQISSVLAGK
jgi:thymidylate kinase